MDVDCASGGESSVNPQSASLTAPLQKEPLVPWRTQISCGHTSKVFHMLVLFSSTLFLIITLKNFLLCSIFVDKIVRICYNIIKTIRAERLAKKYESLLCQTP
ncbi:MAG: hypothetical protein FWH48_11790 [Oscillospiraceae bacterium]|nr:hypothetical protein [Oscillospiraceae bacterium]